MAHLILDTINKKPNLFGNIRNFPCKYSEYSISLVLAGLTEAAAQSGSAAEAWHTLQFIKSIAEVTKPLLSVSYPHNPDPRPLDQSFSFSGPLHSWTVFESPSLAQGQTCGSSLLLGKGTPRTLHFHDLVVQSYLFPVDELDERGVITTATACMVLPASILCHRA